MLDPLTLTIPFEAQPLEMAFSNPFVSPDTLVPEALSHLLIVDDSTAQRFALASLLEEAGYMDLLLASSAQEALELLQTFGPGDIQLILMDLDMPGLNGIEACRQIKAEAEWQDTPIIMVTSSDEADDLKQAFIAGAMDYITKPPNEVELLARVRSALKLKAETESRKAREVEVRRINAQLENLLVDLAEKHSQLQVEREKSEMLLLNILPRPIAERLKSQPGVIADRFEAVTVLFADLVDFTPLSAQSDPEQLVNLLNEVFSLFDQLAEKHGLEKIKTIGDAYMAVAGLPTPRSDHARAAANMALDIQRELKTLASGLLTVRVGLHSGPVMAGVIGTKKFIYDLWGDTVNIASRMESHGLPGGIQLTEATRQQLCDHYPLTPRGAIPVKGRGEMMTYLLQDTDSLVSA